MNCNSRIALDNGQGQAETYCILPNGHGGLCEPDPVIKARYAKRDKENNTNGISTDILPAPK